MRKKQKAGKNSITKKVDMINQAISNEVIVPPCGLQLTDFEQLLWDTFIKSRQPSDWNDPHLVLLYNLVKTQSELMQERELYALESSVMHSDRGTPVPNPRGRIIADLSRLIVTQAKPLALDASPSDIKTIKAQSKDFDDVKSKMSKKPNKLLA